MVHHLDEGLWDLIGHDGDLDDVRNTEIWHSLMRYLRWQNHPDPEEGAQETIVRALSKLDNEEALRQAAEDPHGYFFGFAFYVAREGWRPQRADYLEDHMPQIEARARREDTEERIFVDELLNTLPSAERDLLLRYHTEDRVQLSRELGIQIETLRVNVHRICKRLRELAAQ